MCVPVRYFGLHLCIYSDTLKIMFLIEKTVTFDRWLTRLRDPVAKARVLVQIKKVEAGNLGSSKSLGGGLSELKIDYGPGYRLYYTRKRRTVIWLLCGGDKRSQRRDIEKALKLLDELELKNG
jgi:putative addiction module killer protein